MAVSDFDAFQGEIAALKVIISSYKRKTVRDDDLRERFRTLLLTWTSVIRPAIEVHLASKKDFFKLDAELQSLARLSSRVKSVEEYRRRLNRAQYLAHGLVLYLPPSGSIIVPARPVAKDRLFLPGIPDLPVHLVPNPLVGWRAKIEAFVGRHPFDKSVFIMIRYRKRNGQLISQLKRVLSANGFTAVLASEHNLTNDLYNPIACLLSCSRGIAVFDQSEERQDFNPNVAYELGMMHLLGREVLILKHTSLKSLHTDILMRLYHEYDSPSTAACQVATWMAAQ